MEYMVGGACGKQKNLGEDEKCIQGRYHVEYLGSYGVILNESSGWDGSVLDLFGHGNKSPGSLRLVEFRDWLSTPWD